uniref:Alpha-actinin-2 n=1 Tax=Chelonoidis abingdonii TaxID=106734 RepID=A0A8C0GL82_CHEAB
MNQIETSMQYSYQYEDDEYMIQEEEWDRDMLLDPAWEKQQRKVRKENKLCRGHSYSLAWKGV